MNIHLLQKCLYGNLDKFCTCLENSEANLKIPGYKKLITKKSKKKYESKIDFLIFRFHK